MNSFLGIDVSTTATKALLINEQETFRYSFRGIPVRDAATLWSEQHPDLWWDGAQKHPGGDPAIRC